MNDLYQRCHLAFYFGFPSRNQKPWYANENEFRTRFVKFHGFDIDIEAPERLEVVSRRVSPSIRDS